MHHVLSMIIDHHALYAGEFQYDVLENKVSIRACYQHTAAYTSGNYSVEFLISIKLCYPSNVYNSSLYCNLRRGNSHFESRQFIL